MSATDQMMNRSMTPRKFATKEPSSNMGKKTPMEVALLIVPRT